MTPQPMLEMTAIAPTGPLFFKCPMGGYASLRPGLCPKCKELLVPVFVIRHAAANEKFTSGPWKEREKFCA